VAVGGTQRLVRRGGHHRASQYLSVMPAQPPVRLLLERRARAARPLGLRVGIGHLLQAPAEHAGEAFMQDEEAGGRGV
jgi:hypothetical protein